MKKIRIGILDSGIGGISVLYELNKTLNNVKFYYLGDSENAPYGNKTLTELDSITKINVNLLLTYKVDIIVFACNTLSVSLFERYKNYLKNFNVNLFGVYPPVERYLMNNKKVLLLATNKTIEYYKSIYKRDARLFLLPLNDLALDIERNKFSLDNVSLLELKYKLENLNIKGNFTLILGCTHYYFVKNQIINHIKPQTTISSEYYTCNTIFNELKTAKILDKIKQNEICFVGNNSKENKKFWEYFIEK